MYRTRRSLLPLVVFLVLGMLVLLPACTSGISQAKVNTEIPFTTPSAAPTETLAPSATVTAVPSATSTLPPPTPTNTISSTREPTAAATPTSHPDAILQFRVAFNPSGASFTYDGKVILLYKDAQFELVQAEDGSPIMNIIVPDRVSSFDLSADGSWLAAASVRDGIGTDIHVYETKSGALLYSIPAAHSDSVPFLRFSPDGKLLLSASIDHSVKLWNASDGILNKTIQAQRDSITCMGVAPNGNFFVTGSWFTDSEVIAWTVDGQKAATLSKTNTHCYLTVFSPDSRWVLFHSSEKMSLYQVSDWDRQWLADFSLANTPFVGFTPDGLIYLANRKGTVELKDAASQSAAGRLELGNMAGFSFSPDGESVVVVRTNGIVEILKVVIKQ